MGFGVDASAATHCLQRVGRFMAAFFFPLWGVLAESEKATGTSHLKMWLVCGVTHGRCATAAPDDPVGHKSWLYLKCAGVRGA